MFYSLFRFVGQSIFEWAYLSTLITILTFLVLLLSLRKMSLRSVSRILQQLHKELFMVTPDCAALHNDICMFISYIAGQKNQFVRSFTECVALQNGLKAPLSHVDVSAK